MITEFYTLHGNTKTDYSTSQTQPLLEFDFRPFSIHIDRKSVV